MKSTYLNTLQRILLIAVVGYFVITGTVVNAQDAVHVTKSGSPDPDGSQSKPYHMVEAGVVRTLTDASNTVLIESGTYYETFTADMPSVLKAAEGTVTIGRLDYQDVTSLDIVTVNTHLAGDEIFLESWQDYARADDIADFVRNFAPSPDVVAFQEIWDEDLFFGGDGARGIFPNSGYRYGDHGDDEMGVFINSGLALLSTYPLIGFQQFEWDACDGIFNDCGSAKGWVQSTIVKDSFSIGLFNLHTTAGEESDEVATRREQLKQLIPAIAFYRLTNPSSVVFVVGDFNIYGEEFEYDGNLIYLLGSELNARDADRNSPGFIFDSDTQYTLCRCNPLAIYFDDETISGRLDYMFYVPSLDGTTEVLPLSVDVIQFTGRTLTTPPCPSVPGVPGVPGVPAFPCIYKPLTTNQSSDHWGVHGQFQLIRTAEPTSIPNSLLIDNYNIYLPSVMR